MAKGDFPNGSNRGLMQKRGKRRPVSQNAIKAQVEKALAQHELEKALDEQQKLTEAIAQFLGATIEQYGTVEGNTGQISVSGQSFAIAAAKGMGALVFKPVGDGLVAVVSYQVPDVPAATEQKTE